MTDNHHARIAREIVDALGGPDNIRSVTHCQTRLRFVVRDRSLIDDDVVENIDEVQGVFFASGQYQVIVGTGTVNDVYAAIEDLGEVNAIYGKDDDDEDTDDAGEDGEKPSLVKRTMAMLAGIFIPIVPVIAATGLFLGLRGAATDEQVLALFNATLDDIPETFMEMTSVLTDTVFAFLPALIVWSTFRYFKGTPVIGIVIGLMLVSPILPDAYAVADGSEDAIMLFDFIPVVGNQGSVLTALFAGYIGTRFEKFFRRHMPNVVEQIFTPFLTMLTTFLVMIMLVGPIVHWIELAMVDGVEYLIGLPLGIGGALVGAAYPMMVLVGIHHTMIMIETSMLGNTGLNPLITLAGMYGFANLGVALAMFLRARSDKAKATSMGAFMSQLFGVSEPTLFGILIRYNLRPLIVTVSVSGVAGAFLSLLHVQANSYGLAVLPSYLMYIYDTRALLLYLVVSVLAVAAAFIATNLFAIPKEILVPDGEKDDGKDETDTVVAEVADVAPNTVYSPIRGTTTALSEVNDPVFVSGKMGDGLGVVSDEDGVVSVYAPQSGKLKVVADTGHAYGLKTDTGLEVLVHIGIDTVNLKGAPFETAVTQGETVRQGSLLGTFDKDAIEAEGLDATVVVIVTNTRKMETVTPVSVTGEDGVPVLAGTSVITATPKDAVPSGAASSVTEGA
ncbi:glucose PTS transporter subunit IIA [Corynebacterium sp.]|uniref:PTS beta-glucoside transporter subunit IIBCA n=1 Tax=Corynebacterium sp. TaxID=1720 RepID=UPI002649399A|nr:glucose PTS transporter subunit IIA [Corynebacterium sp.]MDN5719430.1 glucose PTS transporter subunit IIA [Corynebacterium sp.]